MQQRMLSIYPSAQLDLEEKILIEKEPKTEKKKLPNPSLTLIE